MKKYKAGHYCREKIEEVEVIRETAACVYVHGWAGRESRFAKRSDFGNYFDTWEEAHQYLIDKAQKEVDGYRINLERAKGDLGNIKGLKKPANQGE